MAIDAGTGAAVPGVRRPGAQRADVRGEEGGVKRRRIRDRAKLRANNKAYRVKHIEAGLCDRCPVPALSGRSKCERHTELNNRYAREHARRALWVVRIGPQNRCGICDELGHNRTTCPVKRYLRKCGIEIPRSDPRGNKSR